MSRAVVELAEELPEYQTSRGAEFRNLSVEERIPLAQVIVRARSQAGASNADWDDNRFRSQMMKKKEAYMYQAGTLDIDIKEARHIWMKTVYSDASPQEVNTKGLI